MATAHQHLGGIARQSDKRKILPIAGITANAGLRIIGNYFAEPQESAPATLQLGAQIMIFNTAHGLCVVEHRRTVLNLADHVNGRNDVMDGITLAPVGVLRIVHARINCHVRQRPVADHSLRAVAFGDSGDQVRRLIGGASANIVAQIDPRTALLYPAPGVEIDKQVIDYPVT